MSLSNRLSILLLLLIGLLSQNSFAEFPDDPKPCPHGDSDCLVNIINYFVQQKPKGLGDIGLKALDPLKVDKMSIKQGAESAVNINLSLTDNELTGLSDSTVTKVKGFGEDLTKKHEIAIKCKRVSLAGDYTINGRVLILPISGSGKSNITTYDSDMVLTFKGEPVEKDGDMYMKAKDLRLRIKPKRVTYFYGNLFNGDKALGDNMNAFLNENWQDIWNEVEDSVAVGFEKVLADLIDGVFGKYPYKKYFVE